MKAVLGRSHIAGALVKLNECIGDAEVSDIVIERRRATLKRQIDGDFLNMSNTRCDMRHTVEAL